MVRLQSHCRKDHLCHQLCLRWTSLEDKLKYLMSVESEESTAIQLKVMRIGHLDAFWTLETGLTGMGTWKIQITADTTERQTMILA